MAEAAVRKKQFQYAANSNLVLTAERDKGSRAREPTGEVASLRDKLGGTRMGDRAQRARPPTLDEEARKKKEARKRRRDEQGDRRDKRKRARDRKQGVFVAGQGASVLTETQDMEATSYRPKTKETAAVYEQVLSVVQRCIGDQPQEILRGMAEEALYIIKSDTVSPKEKQGEVEKLLSKMPNSDFNKLVNLAKAITDFTKDDDAADEDVDASKARAAPPAAAVLLCVAAPPRASRRVVLTLSSARWVRVCTGRRGDSGGGYGLGRLGGVRHGLGHQ